MEQVAEKIQLYHHLFLGCLALALLCLMLSLVLFFFLDIGQVLGYLTGFQRKRVIRKMEEQGGGKSFQYEGIRRDDAELE